MIDGKEIAGRDGREKKIPSSHFLAAGKAMVGFENLGRMAPRYNILAEENRTRNAVVVLENVSRPNSWAKTLLRDRIAIEFGVTETN
jgi:hypothetical protein